MRKLLTVILLLVSVTAFPQIKKYQLDSLRIDTIQGDINKANWDIYIQKEKVGDVISITLDDGLKSGGNVTWTSGLSFAITPSVYYIGGERYETLQESVTLDTADATYGRIDVIALDTLSNAIVIKGTPSTNPQKPTIDPQAHVELTNVLLPSGATEPVPPSGGTFTTVVVYDENTEWTGTATNVTADFASTAQFYSGSVSTDVGEVGNYDNITYTDASARSFFDYTTVSFYIKLKESMPSTHSISLSLMLSGIQKAVIDQVTLNKTSTDWQLVTVSFADLVKSGTEFDAVRIMYRSPNAIETITGFYLDKVFLQGGIDQPTGEYQELSTNGTAGHVALTNSPEIYINVDDADADSTNELQTLSLSGQNLVISDGNTIDLGLVSCNETVQTLTSGTDTLNVSNGLHGILDISSNSTIRIEPTADCNTGNIKVKADAAGYTLEFVSDYPVIVSPYLTPTLKVITTSAVADGRDVYSYWFDGEEITINGTKEYQK